MNTITQAATSTELAFEQHKGNYFNSYKAESDTHLYKIIKMHGDNEYTAQCIDKKTEECISETFRSMPSAFKYCDNNDETDSH